MILKELHPKRWFILKEVLYLKKISYTTDTEHIITRNISDTKRNRLLRNGKSTNLLPHNFILLQYCEILRVCESKPNTTNDKKLLNHK